MSRTCFRFDIFRRWKHLPDTSCTALTHDTTAQRAHPKCASSIEPMPPSATAEAVGIATALRLQRARQLPACGAQAAASSCGSPPAASRGLPTHPEAHSVVAYMIDGLRAKGLISWQRKVAKWWSVDLTTAPTCSADEPIRKAADSSKTLVRSSSRELCGPWHAALDVRSGPGAAQLTRTTSRGLARSRTVASGTMPGRPEVRFVSVRERVKLVLSSESQSIFLSRAKSRRRAARAEDRSRWQDGAKADLADGRKAWPNAWRLVVMFSARHVLAPRYHPIPYPPRPPARTTAHPTPYVWLMTLPLYHLRWLIAIMWMPSSEGPRALAAWKIAQSTDMIGMICCLAQQHTSTRPQPTQAHCLHITKILASVRHPAHCDRTPRSIS